MEDVEALNKDNSLDQFCWKGELETECYLLRDVENVVLFFFNKVFQHVYMGKGIIQ